jgi:flagellar protein FliS
MNNAYQTASTVDLEEQVDSASPHELINMLLRGARSHIAKAQGHLQRQEMALKGEHISKALNIIEGLKLSLNHEKGGKIAQNLQDLYGYIQKILLKGNLNNNIEALKEANQLLATIHDGWNNIK